jgi:histidinol-phosphate aminotransferase
MTEAERRVRRWIRPEVQVLGAYHVPDPAGLIKLNAMENPYRWPPELIDEWLRELRDVEVNRYPDAGAVRLKQRLRQAFAIPEGLPILLGNGSDELIQLLVMAVASPGATVLAPQPSFVMYRHSSVSVGARFVGVPLAEGYQLPHNAMLAAIAEHQPAIVFLAFPNNPTGNLFARAVVDDVIAKSPGLVVVDEAYAPFAEASYLNRIEAHPNLIVMRTMSKMGLAGLRLGFLVGDPAWLAELEKLRLPYNVNVLTQATVEFALRHREVLDEQTRSIREERARVARELARFPGVHAFPSAANFILLKTRPGAAGLVFARLLEQGVLIKNLDGAGPGLEDCLRATVGSPDQNDAFLGALARALEELH